MTQYLPILAMIVLVVLFVSLSFAASTRLGPRRPTSAKRAPYECGIVPEHEPAERFPVKFYLVAMAFIVLDVEIIFLYPFTTILRDLGTYGLVAMGVFLILTWIRWSFIRIRVDQILQISWKVLLPVSVLLVIATAVVIVLREPTGG